MNTVSQRTWKGRSFVYFLLTLFWLTPFAHSFATRQVVSVVGNEAEWDRPTDILMHTPGEETFWGILHPNAALFERTFSVAGAGAEHKHYISLLEKRGIRVHTVMEVLLQGTLKENGTMRAGEELDELRKLARASMTLDLQEVPENTRRDEELYLEKVFQQMHPKELVKVILERPTVKLRRTAINTGYDATYSASPVMNLYFLRDQMITTKKGVVISRMNSEQRSPEVEIIKLVLKKLGVTPLYEVKGEGRLEGGDFIPIGDTALIGQGLRTNAEAIRQLLQQQVFGTQYVVVVKEGWKNQQQMHLDTYFNVISPKLAVLVGDRMVRRNALSGKMDQPLPLKKLSADIYQLSDNGYVLREKDQDFQSFLEKKKGMHLIPVSDKDQEAYGVNFLTVAPGTLFGIEGVSADYKRALKKKGVRATWMDFSNLTGGYGAAHCSTQVLHRVK